MVVIVLHKYEPSLAGKLSRWMLQVSAGVFVGKLSAKVREKVWDLVKDEGSELNGTLCATDDSEQGFQIKQLGNAVYSIEDFDGLPLILRRKRSPTVE